MATMIPPQYDESTQSAAEKRLFDQLARDPDTHGWVVLHSLGLSERQGRPYGEIDFVVLVPGGGILCLEVKGGRVRCENGVWTVQDRTGATHTMRRSPFLQAREGMFALREALLSRFGTGGDVARVPMGYAVVFPDVDAPPPTSEFESWEVAGRTELRKPVSEVVRRMLRGQRRRLGEGVEGGLLTERLTGQVRQALRPDFEVVVTRATRIARVEEKLLRLEVDQYDVLDRIHDNPRCLVRGAAGTGKTVLAVEHARRAARDGLRVLLVCYNRLLGDRLAAQFDGVECVTVGSYHRVLRRLVLSSALADEFRADERRMEATELFDEAYPLYGELLPSQAYDVVVLDEAQDLVNDRVLPVLNAHLKGGLAGGRWAFFGDFSRQALFGSADTTGADDVLGVYAPHYTRERLTTNCRNTRQVGEEMALLSGFDEPPFRFCRVEGLSVDYRYWRGARQAEALDRAIREHLEGGGNAADLVVLSPLDFGRSAASGLDGGDAYRIVDVREFAETQRRAPPAVSFCTVQAFKGLESPAVVLCDIEAVDDHEPQSLLYVGMSRARSHLSVLLHERTRPAVTRLTTRRLLAGWAETSL